MTEGMTSALSAKLNRIFKMKQEIKALEDELKPLVEEIKAIALQSPRGEDGLWRLENGTAKAQVSATVKVLDTAIEYLQGLGRGDLVSSKPYVKFDALAQVIGEEDMIKNSLASYAYVLRVTEKKE
ncbi:MAG: hypothetical protein WCQ53_05665 [bacterium]